MSTYKTSQERDLKDIMQYGVYLKAKWRILNPEASHGSAHCS